MSDFDLRDPSVRLLECAKCHEPVAGDARTARMTLACGYCGFEDVREVSAPAPASDEGSAYRGKAGREPKPLRIDLSAPLEGVPARATAAAVRPLFVAAKTALAGELSDDDRRAAEFRLVWLASFLAVHHIAARDFLHARTVLETTLEAVSTPAYEALVLARLARLAAMSNAQELGDKWLELAPKGLRIAEVKSDLRVADAMLARARGDARAVLRIIGEQDTASEFVGGARWLAVALRVDAHENVGEAKLARQLWREASRGNATALSGAASAYGLAPATRKRVQLAAVFALPGFAAFLWGAFQLLRSVIEDPAQPHGLVPLAIGLLAVVVATRL